MISSASSTAAPESARRGGRRRPSRPRRGSGRMTISPNRPPKTARSPAALPGTGITRTAVVLWLITPMATSSAIRAARVSASVSPGTAIMSRPTEQTAVIASSFARVRSPSSTALRQRRVLADGDERAREAADRRRGEAPALLDRVVQKRQRGRRARGADPDDAHRLEDLADAVADLRRRGQRQVDDPEGDAEPRGDLAADQLADARDAEGRALDLLGDLAQRRRCAARARAGPRAPP